MRATSRLRTIPLHSQSIPLGWMALFLMVLGSASFSWGCSVPVFRYALEKWESDPYVMTVFHDKPLSKAEQKRLQQLSVAIEDQKNPLNLVIRQVDLTQNPTERMKQLWERQQQKTLPWITIEYPESADLKRKLPSVRQLWNGSFNELDVEGLIDSPLRKKLATELVSGKTSVWLFIESGNADQDRKVYASLQRQLKRLEQSLELPEPDPQDLVDGNISVDPKTLKIQFSILKLSRKDPKEQFLLKMLLNSEDDLWDFSEPMAIPIFGRARILYVLIGAGITNEDPSAQFVRQACELMTGACTCTVKTGNPGTDMLLRFNWERHIESQLKIDTSLPDLPLLSGLTSSPSTTLKEKRNKRVPLIAPRPDQVISPPLSSENQASNSSSPETLIAKETSIAKKSSSSQAPFYPDDHKGLSSNDRSNQNLIQKSNLTAKEKLHPSENKKKNEKENETQSVSSNTKNDGSSSDNQSSTLQESGKQKSSRPDVGPSPGQLSQSLSRFIFQIGIFVVVLLGLLSLYLISKKSP